MKKRKKKLINYFIKKKKIILDLNDINNDKISLSLKIMGGGAYNVTSSFCFSCLRFTEHRVYTDRRETTDTIKVWDSNERKFKDDHYIYHTYITTTEVCTRCGKSSSKTEHYKSESCQIFWI